MELSIVRNTFDMPQHLRAARWNSMLGEVSPAFRIDTLGACSLEGQVEERAIGQIRLVRVETSPHKMSTMRSDSAMAPTHAMFIFQLEGSHVLEQDGKTLEVGPGECLAYDASRAHVLACHDFASSVGALVPNILLAQTALANGKLVASKVSANTGSARLAFRLIDEMIRQRDALSAAEAFAVSKSLIDILVLPFLSKMDRAASPSGADALRWRAKAYIEGRLSEPELSPDETAAALGCSTRYLHKAFELEGQSISRFIWDRRLTRCRDEIIAGRGGSVTEIAFAWGFSSSAHFSRLFKAKYGQSPSALVRGRVAGSSAM